MKAIAPTKTSRVDAILRERYAAGVPYGSMTTIACKVGCTGELVRQRAVALGITHGRAASPVRWCSDCGAMLSRLNSSGYCDVCRWDHVKSRRQHATVSRYSDGCRCEDCRRANADYYRERAAQRSPEDAPKHGTINAYVNYGCRCEPCRAAGSAANAFRSGRNPATVRRRPYKGRQKLR